MAKKKELSARQSRIEALESKMFDGMLTQDELVEYEKLVRLEATVGEADAKKKTGKTQRVTAWIGAGTGLLGSIGSIFLFNNYVNQGFEFEKEGTFTSTTFKEVIRRINLPKFLNGGK